MAQINANFSSADDISSDEETQGGESESDVLKEVRQREESSATDEDGECFPQSSTLAVVHSFQKSRAPPVSVWITCPVYAAVFISQLTNLAATFSLIASSIEGLTADCLCALGEGSDSDSDSDSSDAVRDHKARHRLLQHKLSLDDTTSKDKAASEVERRSGRKDSRAGSRKPAP